MRHRFDGGDDGGDDDGGDDGGGDDDGGDDDRHHDKKNFQAKTWVTGARGSLQADYWFQPRWLESPGVGIEIVANN